MKTVIERYLAALEDANYLDIIELFDEDAYIESPLEGRSKPADFYGTLFQHTNRSRTKPLDLLIGAKWTAVFFQYHWKMEDGTKVQFDCVDLLELNRDDVKIK